MRTRRIITVCLVCIFATSLSAQDANISQMTSEARNVSKTPEGDRSYYGLWAKDRLMDKTRYKRRYASPEDSIRKRNEFVELCGIAFKAYEEKDAMKTIVYGDSALQTGFDNAQIYFYMAVSFEKLGDLKQAGHYYKEAKAHGLPGGKEALAAFKKRMKERKNESKSKSK